MSIVYKSRVLVVRFAKVFPFILCFVVFISYAEGLYALANENYCTFDNSIVLYKPVSWFIGNLYLYDWRTVALATVLSFAMETCLANKACVIFLLINELERLYFITVELYPEQVAAIITINALVCAWLCWKGVQMLK